MLAEPVDRRVARVLAVIILYKVQPAESAAFRTLMAAKSDRGSVHESVRVLLYDNTPGGCDPGPLPPGVQYEAAEQNVGLAPAYNRALEIALRAGDEWLLILDQDTKLPSDYISRISGLALDLEADTEIAAIVPRMIDAGRAVAPVFIRFWGSDYRAAACEGTSPREIHATNSATLFRASALRQIGGFSEYFWLDYLDGYVFHQLHRQGLKVYVARDITVEHSLSLLHSGELSPDRFRNILLAESAYWDLYGGSVQRAAFAGRLVGRIWRQWRRGHDSAILNLTRKELQRRVFQSRGHRINEWKLEMEGRLRSFSSADGPKHFDCRPHVSVCMAAYNGELYIVEQLNSILNQLHDEDEVIVVDDASIDRTRDSVRSINDKRVRLIEHRQNLGVLRSFEDAIRNASGSILFLSDQDDLWASNKVSTMLREFQLHPEADLAVSDASLIKENGAPLGSSYYAERGRFQAGVIPNIFRCKYLGCTMAFRSRIRAHILPFPREAHVLHDLWIGTAHSLAGGKTLYIDRPLVLYRRHEGNVTGNRRLPITRRIRIR